MDATLPAIYAVKVMTSPLAWSTRLIAASISLGCLAVLLFAVWIPPNPSGVGSHASLGLDACQFLARTGLPCPSCGMTTSFSWFVRGNLLASLYVQPMGTALAAMAGCCVWAAGYIALTGRPAHRLLRLLPGRHLLIALLAFAVLAWAWKVWIHLNRVDGWA